ncbi:hypothetical protein FE257_004009 [Aspergillus nanangensis]|uniref:Acyl-CoA thioesterase II n=1 Tax=Aspergillus nanangensis TaxID=2582783 RepID=A0AAD4CTN6_ASPNN|nr:hypothetical protein FE257_004009 [Aspergillus nanangensis]
MNDALALTLVPSNGQDIYTNTSPHWRPPWGRGIFGGGLIAQSLCAAQRTVHPTFHAHSMHCYFLRPGSSSDPVFYHIERIRDGHQFTCRMVRATQQNRTIFTATVSFTHESPQHKTDMFAHGAAMPRNMTPPPEVVDRTILAKAAPAGKGSPYECVRCPIDCSGVGIQPEQRKLRQWIRAKGPVGDTGVSHQSNLAALAYMTDSYFIGTTARVHGATRFADQQHIERTVESLGGTVDEEALRREYLEELACEEAQENEKLSSCAAGGKASVRVGMMVSLDHTIFFHQTRKFLADQWMLVEMDSPWAGNERGLVTQRIWSQTGDLIATAVQEGIVRLTPTGVADAKL